jgi:hypothetical protein
MTADFAIAAVSRGWLPGRRLVVVGDGRFAAGTTDRLSGAGASVAALPARRRGADAGSSVDAVRGQPRLTGVLADGTWLDADGLVLADRLQPATFLLRGLGIGDERPGVPAPVDATGALPLERAWAAGTCVSADVDHTGSLSAGRDVAQAILAAIGAATHAATGPTRR